jgi:hypothetical protein
LGRGSGGWSEGEGPGSFKTTVHSTFKEMSIDDTPKAESIDSIEGIRQTIQLILKAYNLSEEDINNRKYSDEMIVWDGYFKDTIYKEEN